MRIEGKISVKFRAFGVTLGTFTKTFSEPVPAFDATILTIKDRGVELVLRSAETGKKP